MSPARPRQLVGQRSYRGRAWFTRTRGAWCVAGSAALLAACSGGIDAPNASAARNCAGATATSLGVAQSALADCSNGGTRAVVGAGGANYLIVAQFATDEGSASPVSYALSADTGTGPALADLVPPPVAQFVAAPAPGAGLQSALDLKLRARERAARGSAVGSAMPARAMAASTVPTAGSVRTFRVLTDYAAAGDVWTTVTASLEFIGANVLIYSDTRTPYAGFTADALAQFGRYFDETLFPIDTAAFGPPSDVDGNGHVIMLMSPAVNAGTPSATCLSQGFVAGFFNGQDFNGAGDPNSNDGEIFYSLVADPQGTYGCPHPASDVSDVVPAVFLHEMQHLISYSQHVVVGGGKPAASWMDEGMSLVAEELGSAYYEAKCPPPACRTDPAQLLPDSSMGFARTFMFDSYAFASRPDSVSVTLHADRDLGTAWRGGAWALMRWLGDHMPPGFYRRLETTQGSGAAAIESASGGQDFARLFGNFGLALYTDSLPGMPRNTVPVADRFSTRNTRQLWTNLLGTSAAELLPFPIPVHDVTGAATVMQLRPGGTAFWRLGTPSAAATETIHFSAPDGRALDPRVHAQLVIFRLPPGQ